jgi:hypothetical protein
MTASDGTWEVYQKQLGWIESVDHTPRHEHIIIDTSLPLAHNVKMILDRIG